MFLVRAFYRDYHSFLSVIGLFFQRSKSSSGLLDFEICFADNSLISGRLMDRLNKTAKLCLDLLCITEMYLPQNIL